MSGMRRAPRRTRRERAEERTVIDDLNERPAGGAFGGDYHMAPPQPAYIPRPPAPTGAQPMLAESPLDNWVPVEPSLPALIGDAIPAPEPQPEPEPELPLEYQVPADARAVLWSGPGWAGRRMQALVREGAWEELPALVEKGLGENAAESATAFRHNAERITDAARQVCAALGAPHMTGTLLARVRDMTVTARQGTGPQRMPFRTPRETGQGRGPGSAGLPHIDPGTLNHLRDKLRDAS